MASIPDDWRQIHVKGAFSFHVPERMQAQDVQPIDSKVGILTDAFCELYYDFGRYAGDLSEYTDRPGAEVESLQIDDFEAQIAHVQERDNTENHPHISVVHFPSLQGGNRLTMRLSCKQSARDTARAIFQSIRFE